VRAGGRDARSELSLALSQVLARENVALGRLSSREAGP
jgi:hypothetical protein